MNSTATATYLVSTTGTNGLLVEYENVTSPADTTSAHCRFDIGIGAETIDGQQMLGFISKARSAANYPRPAGKAFRPYRVDLFLCIYAYTLNKRTKTPTKKTAISHSAVSRWILPSTLTGRQP